MVKQFLRTSIIRSTPISILIQRWSPIITVEKTNEGVNLRLRSSALIRGLYLYVDDDESFFEQNYVTLIPGKEEVVQVKTHLSAAAFEKQLKYLSVNQVN